MSCVTEGRLRLLNRYKTFIVVNFMKLVWRPEFGDLECCCSLTVLYPLHCLLKRSNLSPPLPHTPQI